MWVVAGCVLGVGDGMALLQPYWGWRGYSGRFVGLGEEGFAVSA